MSNSENEQTRNDNLPIDGGDGRNEQPNVVECTEDSASTSTLTVNESPAAEATSAQSATSKMMASAISEACRQYEDSVQEQEQSDRMDYIVQCLRALDVQVIGACRADERLKPLLKINAFTGAAEDRLLSHLSQHFDPSEVGLLARCLCVPLVSVRVGKINKLGGLLCPTATRGNLNLTLLPTSDLRISFIGDDGSAERLSTLMTDAQCSAIKIEEISADKSGRSFMLKIPDNAVYYFWCSEKSKLLGSELLRKMEDLFKQKPSLAELTGISESRLESFGIYLQAYLVGSTMTNARPGSVLALTPSHETSIEPSDSGLSFQSSIGSKPSRLRQSGGQGSKTSPLYQGSLSPRPSAFKEAVARNLSSLRSVSRERFRRRGDSFTSCIDDLVAPSIGSSKASGSNASEDQLQEVTRDHVSSLLESPEESENHHPTGSGDQTPLMGSSRFSPYYCWCPSVSSSLQYSPENVPLSTPSTESLSLPNSLFSVSKSSAFLTSKLPFSLNDIPPLDFPPLFPLPLSFPASQQIPTFTPLMCDPIVHVPVIEVCSSGQGYLVSAGPAISTAISPLHPNLSNPLNPESDSLAEKSARETLRMLINSSNQPNPPLLFPSVLSSGSELHSILAVGSRGLYSGSTGNEMHNILGVGSRGLYSPPTANEMHSILAVGSRGLYSPPTANEMHSILAVGSRGLYSPPTANEMHSILAVGSRGLYSGTNDVGAIASSVAAMSMVSSSDGFVLDRLSGRGSLFEDLENAEGFSGPRFDNNVPESGEGSC